MDAGAPLSHWLDPQTRPAIPAAPPYPLNTIATARRENLSPAKLENIRMIHGENTLKYYEYDSSHFLSNWYDGGGFYASETYYRSPMHYYFASIVDPVYRDAILDCASGKDLVNYIGKSRCPVPKTGVESELYFGVLHTFDGNSSLKEKLLKTGQASLVNISTDAYYGAGLDGTGTNKLGDILAMVRGILK